MSLCSLVLSCRPGLAGPAVTSPDERAANLPYPCAPAWCQVNTSDEAQNRNVARQHYLKHKMSITVALITVLSGCGTASVVDESDPPPSRESAQSVMIGRASRALDASFTAEYSWSEGGTVTVWTAEDGTWRVDVPAWALGGQVDVSVAWTTGGFFQCAEGVCVKLAGITGQIPGRYDPKVQLPFVEWLPRLLDRQLPFVVSREEDCFTLTPNTVVVEDPMPPGQWCLDEHGTLLSVSNRQIGTLELEGEPGDAVETVELPGEIVDGDPVDRKAPEPQTPTPSDSGSPTPSESADPGDSE